MQYLLLMYLLSASQASNPASQSAVFTTYSSHATLTGKTKRSFECKNTTCTSMCIYSTDGSTDMSINNIEGWECQTWLRWTISWSHFQLLIRQNRITQRKIRGQPYTNTEARRQQRIPLQFSNKVPQP